MFLGLQVKTKAQAYAVLSSFWVDYPDLVEDYVEETFNQGIIEEVPMTGLEMIQDFLIGLDAIEG